MLDPSYWPEALQPMMQSAHQKGGSRRGPFAPGSRNRDGGDPLRARRAKIHCRAARRAAHQRAKRSKSWSASPAPCAATRRPIFRGRLAPRRTAGGHLRHRRRFFRAHSTSRRRRPSSRPARACASPSTATARSPRNAARPMCSKRWAFRSTFRRNESARRFAKSASDFFLRPRCTRPCATPCRRGGASGAPRSICSAL